MARRLVLVFSLCLCIFAHDRSKTTHFKPKGARSPTQEKQIQKNAPPASTANLAAPAPNPNSGQDAGTVGLPASSNIQFDLPTFKASEQDTINSWLLWYMAVAVLLFLLFTLSILRFWSLYNLLPDLLAFQRTKENIEQHRKHLESLKTSLSAQITANTAASSAVPAPPTYAAPICVPELSSYQPAPKAAPPRDRNWEVVTGYRAVIQASNQETELNAFRSKYPYQRISCMNYEDLRVDPRTRLRFTEDRHGTLLMVSNQDDIYALPWFFNSLTSSRDRLEGIFKFPSSEFRRLRLASPAELTQEVDEWILSKPGVLESDG